MPPRASSPPSAPPTRAATRRKRTRCTGPGCRRLAPPGRKRCDDCKPGRRKAPPPRPAFGRTEPRIWTKPLRPLTRETSHGYRVIDFASKFGMPLLPWQEWALIHALELNPDGTYRFRKILILVARQNGKSHLKRVVTLWRMYMTGARRIIGVAQDVALARDQWNMCQEAIHADPDLEAEWGKVRNVNGDEWFEAASCRYAIKAANGKAGRGGSNDEVNIDELREQHDWKAWAAVSKTIMARRHGQIWAMSNAGEDSSAVLNNLHDRALAGKEPSLCLMEWSGEKDCAIDDWEQLAQANPGLGYIITHAAIEDSLGDPPGVVRTEVLCQRVPNLQMAIDFPAWTDSADPAGSLDGFRDRLAACVDVAPDGEHVALVAAARLDDGRVRVSVAKAWDSTEAARRELPALLKRMKPRVIAWFPSGPAGALATVLRPRAGQVVKITDARPGRPAYIELSDTEACEVCMEFADLVKSRQVVQPSDPLLDAHVKGASKLVSGDKWRFTRQGEGHVDAAYAAAGAVRAALTLPVPRRARISVLSG